MLQSVITGITAIGLVGFIPIITAQGQPLSNNLAKALVLTIWIAVSIWSRIRSENEDKTSKDLVFVLVTSLVMLWLSSRLSGGNSLVYLIHAEDNASWLDLLVAGENTMSRAHLYGPSIGSLLATIRPNGFLEDPSQIVIGLSIFFLSLAVGITVSFVMTLLDFSRISKLVRLGNITIVGIFGLLVFTISSMMLLFGFFSLLLCLVGLLVCLLLVAKNDHMSVQFVGANLFFCLAWTATVPFSIATMLIIYFLRWNPQEKVETKLWTKKIKRPGMWVVVIPVNFTLAFFFFNPTSAWVARGSQIELMLQQTGGTPNIDNGMILFMTLNILIGFFWYSFYPQSPKSPMFLLTLLGLLFTTLIFVYGAVATATEPGYGSQKLAFLMVPFLLFSSFGALSQLIRETLADRGTALLLGLSVLVASYGFLNSGWVYTGLAHTPVKRPTVVWEDAFSLLEKEGNEPILCVSSDALGALDGVTNIEWLRICNSFLSARYGLQASWGRDFMISISEKNLGEVSAILDSHKELRLLVIPDSSSGVTVIEGSWWNNLVTSERRIELAISTSIRG